MIPTFMLSKAEEDLGGEEDVGAFVEGEEDVGGIVEEEGTWCHYTGL
jgi:hypothetical protein